MELSIPKEDILRQLIKQLDSFFIVSDDEKNVLHLFFNRILDRCEYCFSKTDNKYFRKEGITFFNPLISNQYMPFLYFYANTIAQERSDMFALCDKLYYLNKMMNCLDVFYQVQLPSFFMVEHPVGSVMGRAKYGEGFSFYQNCSVGGFHVSNTQIDYPTIGSNVTMYAKSMVIGSCVIGDNVKIGADCCIKNQNIPANSVVFGSSPNLLIKTQK